MTDPEYEPDVEERLFEAERANEVLVRRVMELSKGLGEVQAYVRTARRALEAGVSPVWELAELEDACRRALWGPGSPDRGPDPEAGW